MKVGLHRYITDPTLPQKDGVNLAHENITRLMSSEHNGLDVVFHDLNELLNLGVDEIRNRLKDLDCIVSNVGPHAHYYFWLRERCGLNFRIIRDVRTAIWSSYLLQEHLIAPLLRPNDTLLVASYYVQGIYHKFFPGLKNSISVKCYPLTVGFPKKKFPRKDECKSENVFTIGYIGRLSEDKNFPQLIDLIISLNKKKNKFYRLVACGDVHSKSCDLDFIANRLKSELGEGNYFVYEPARPHDQIWNLLSNFDLMIFPSTSNLETFGRVLVEASYAKVPVISANHAAASELVPSQNLCDVSYKSNVDFSAHFDHCLGYISILEIEQKILQDKIKLSECFEEFRSHTDLFIKVLKFSGEKNLSEIMHASHLSPSQKKFIDNVCCDMPEPLTKSLAIKKISEISTWFLNLQHSNPIFKQQFVNKLIKLSLHRQRSERFLIKHMKTQGDFTNVGGIDVELCHVLKFYPTFKINS